MSKLKIYHGSTDLIEKPEFGKGKPYNDYGLGFYCTESLDLAKEWACVNNETNGHANKYTISLDGLKVLDLTKESYTILNWVAILLKFRNFDTNTPISQEAKQYLIDNFYIDISKYDVVIGYRADDSYFSFAKDFVNNTISVRQLNKAMELGQLGKQVAIISKIAFENLEFIGYELADHKIFYTKRVARDKKAREEYLSKNFIKATSVNELFVMDIIRKGLKNGDKIL